MVCEMGGVRVVVVVFPRVSKNQSISGSAMHLARVGDIASLENLLGSFFGSHLAGAACLIIFFTGELIARRKGTRLYVAQILSFVCHRGSSSLKRVVRYHHQNLFFFDHN